MVYLGHRQINEVVTTQSPPNRLGHMLPVKASNNVHLINASYSRGTETAEVECLWFSEDLKVCVQNTQTAVLAAGKLLSQLHFPFYSSLPFMHERSS